MPHLTGSGQRDADTSRWLYVEPVQVQLGLLSLAWPGAAGWSWCVQNQLWSWTAWPGSPAKRNTVQLESDLPAARLCSTGPEDCSGSGTALTARARCYTWSDKSSRTAAPQPLLVCNRGCRQWSCHRRGCHQQLSPQEMWRWGCQHSLSLRGRGCVSLSFIDQMVHLGKRKINAGKPWGRNHSSPLSVIKKNQTKTKNRKPNHASQEIQDKICLGEKKILLIKQSAWKNRVFLIFGTDGDQQEVGKGYKTCEVFWVHDYTVL